MLELILVIHDDFISMPLKYLAKRQKSADFCFFPRIKSLNKMSDKIFKTGEKMIFSTQHKCLDL